VELAVLARGERWVVVDKPSGLAIHASDRVRERDTLMRHARRQFGPEVDPVHRLDRATSGCLLLSLSRAEYPALHAAHAAGRKRYLALVRGRVAWDELRCESPLGDDHGNPKDAVTLFVRLGASAEPRCSLLLATPLTGRFHQIRRHLRDLSHPVLGDSSHGDTRVNQQWRRDRGLARLALHCLSLAAPVAVRSPLPAELVTVGAALPWWPEALQHLSELT
jgi:tRNA pseudouridine65 synthase